MPPIGDVAIKVVDIRPRKGPQHIATIGVGDQGSRVRIDQVGQRTAVTRILERNGQVEDVGLVDDLGVGGEVAALEALGQIEAELSPLVCRKTRIAIAVVNPPETARRQIPVTAQRARPIAVQALHACVLKRQPHRRFSRVRSLARYGVDQARWRVGREDRRRS